MRSTRPLELWGSAVVRTRGRFLAALLTTGMLFVAACGDDDDGGYTSAGTEAPAATEAGAEGGGGEAAAGGAITIALGSERTSLDPHLVDDGGERAINDNIYETLLTR